MQLDAELARFVASPVMIILAAADRSRRPALGRGLGVGVEPGASRLHLLFSAWQWPQFAAAASESGRLAATCSRPSDYVSYQLKGPALLRPVKSEEQAAAERYCEDMRAVLGGLGIAPALVDQWLTPREVMAAELEPAEVYLQTPGPRAGAAL